MADAFSVYTSPVLIYTSHSAFRMSVCASRPAEMAKPLGELDTSRASRVKQLEAMVLRLEKENQHLLYRVTDSAEKYQEKASNGVVFDAEDCTRESTLLHAPSNDDLISLNEHRGEGEDEW